jgi:hypothetical protein
MASAAKPSAATTVLDWSARLVCSKCGSHQIDMVVPEGGDSATVIFTDWASFELTAATLLDEVVNSQYLIREHFPSVTRARAHARGHSSASKWTGTRVPRNAGFPESAP